MDFFGGVELSPFSFTCLAAASSIGSGLAAYLLRGPATRIGFVARSRRDRFGRGKTPLTGGLGLLAGICLALLALRVRLPPAWIVGGGGFFLLGLLDDRFEFKPPAKFSGQVAVALATAWLLGPSWRYAGLVVFLLLLLVNASNFLDNMDGLLAGVALAEAVALLEFSLVAGPGAAVLVWALPGILLLTIPPARVYLGDSGSHLIGALLALEAARLLVQPDGLHTRYLLPLALLFGVQIADLTTVVVSRIRRRRPILRGGIDHLSHRLVRLGFSVPRAVFLLVLASGVCGLAALLLLFGS